MSFLRRVWLTVKEIGSLLLGCLASIFVAAWVAAVIPNPDGALLAFLACLVLAITLLSRHRSKHAKWKIQYDAEKYERERAWKRSHPIGARWKRLAVRTGVCLPSVFAAFVLFFFPQASHLLHLGGVDLGPYRIWIPWDILIASGHSDQQFASVTTLAESDAPRGFAQLFHGSRFSASMTFGVRFAPYRFREDRERGGAKREFKLGMNVLRCWENVTSADFRSITCWTSGPYRGAGLSAGFRGEATHVPTFYRILRGIETRFP